jgi:hypothetical protein
MCWLDADVADLHVKTIPHSGLHKYSYIGCLEGTIDFGLFFIENRDPCLLEYTDVGYLSDPNNVRS